jgi:hypothetical protein
MHTLRLALALVGFIASLIVVTSCGSPAQQAGIGTECAANDDCNQGGDDDDFEQTCLSFKGGYCGLEDCANDSDCLGGSACVTHDDGANYCFLLCRDKPECNGGRSAENESNCSGNITFIDPQDDGVKACVPPSA